MFDHFAKNSLISYPGVAQLVGRLIWVQDAGSSNLPTRTSKYGWFRTKSAVFLTFITYSASTSGDWSHKSFFSFSEFPESFYALFLNLQQITYSISTSKCLLLDHFGITYFYGCEDHPIALFFVYCIPAFDRVNTISERGDAKWKIIISSKIHSGFAHRG